MLNAARKVARVRSGLETGAADDRPSIAFAMECTLLVRVRAGRELHLPAGPFDFSFMAETP
jgi:hypothetical protein